MPQVLRVGCAGAAMIAIAALTSIGLYAVVAGGVAFGGTGGRTTPPAAPVLVTIQAAQATATVATIPTSTPMPSSLIAGRAQPPAPSLVPPSAALSPTAGQAVTAMASSSSTPVLPPPLPSPADAASQETGAAAPMPAAALGAQAVYDGLTLEIVEAEPDWLAPASDGAPRHTGDGSQLLTVHVRLVNRAAELRYVADNDLLLVGDDGARYAPRVDPLLREPHLVALPIPAGDTVRGWLTYEVPPGAAPRRLQWSPTRPDRPRAEATFILALP